jgi:hypothetical protein
MAAADYKALVQSIYISYFGRPADTLGLINFSASLDALKAPLTVNGLTAAYTTTPALKSLIDSFGTSAESVALYGTDTVAFVSSIYNNVLNRAPDFDGLVFWVTEINAGRLTKANASLAIMAGAINNTSAQGLIDAQVLANKVTIASNFTASVDTGAELAAYTGNAAAAVARDMLKSVTATTVPATFQATIDATLLQLVNGSSVGVTVALTSGIDALNGTSGNDTFNAVPTGALNSPSFTSLDAINGGAGNDTLVITSVGQLDLSSAAGATVTNVENVTLASSLDIVNADVSGFAGLTNLTLSSTTGTTVTAAATTNVSELASINSSTINGGNNVTVIHKTAGNVLSDKAAGNVKVTSSFGTVTVTNAAADVNVAAKGTINASGKTFTGTALGAATVEKQDTDFGAAQAAATAKSNAISADGTAGGKVTALGTLTTSLNAATDIASNNAATFVAYKAGTITQAQKVSIDAAFSAALTAPGGNLAAAVAAAIAIETPLVTAANAAKAATAATVVTTTAADAIAAAVYAADNAAAGDNVAAGIAVNNITSKILTTASVEGNYLGTTAITDASQLLNQLTTVSLANSGSATLTGNAIANVSLKDQYANVNVVNNAALHAITVNVDAVSGITFSDTIADKITINAISDSGMTVVNSVATGVTVTGAGSFSFGTAAAFAANAAIDASAATGAVSLTTTAGQSFKGGAGNDVVTAGSAVQTAVVDGGAGTDRLVLTTDANFATAAAAAKFVGFETLQLNAGVSADVTAFTGSTLTGIVLNNATKVIGLNATQAGNITARSGTYEIGVAGATTVGQLDTVKMIVSDGTSSRVAVNLTDLKLAGVEVLNLTATDNIVINSLMNSTALTNINVDGAGTTSITTGAISLNVNTVIDAHLTTRAVTVDASAALVNGLKIIGTSGTGINTLTSNNFASVLVGGQGADVLTGGNGSDVITSGNGNVTVSSGAAGAGNIGGDTVLLGNGANTVTLNGSGAATVTVGNGYNTIVTGAGNDKIITGTGGNVVTGGAGGDIITFGAHVAGVIDQINYTAAGQSYAGAAFTSGVTVLTGIDVVTGMHAGDVISITGAGITASTIVGTTGVASTDGSVALVRGNYDLATHIFTTSATGADTMMQYDADAGAGIAITDVILVGFTGSLVAGTNSLLLA